MSAVTGDHSAGLCTTVQPAASAGAIFQVDSMNGVFHGVITPTGPIGTRVEMFQCSSLGVLRPSRASAHLSAKKRKFSAARIAALAMKRCAWPVSMHSSTAMSSARSSIASATRCSSLPAHRAPTCRARILKASDSARSRRDRCPRHCRAPPSPAPRRRPAIWSRMSRRRSTARSCRRSCGRCRRRGAASAAARRGPCWPGTDRISA